MESHAEYIERLSTGQRETEVRADGLVYYPDNGRKVREDKGVRRPHPLGCAHCDMVLAYRLERESQIERYEVACRDEDLVPITFKEWLTSYRYETEYLGLAA